MKAITKIQTFDGETHDSTREALRYLEIWEADILGKVAAHIQNLPRKTQAEIGDAIINKREELILIFRIQDDKKMEDEE